jgi:hypothetical protein
VCAFPWPRHQIPMPQSTGRALRGARKPFNQSVRVFASAARFSAALLVTRTAEPGRWRARGKARCRASALVSGPREESRTHEGRMRFWSDNLMDRPRLQWHATRAAEETPAVCRRRVRFGGQSPARTPDAPPPGLKAPRADSDSGFEAYEAEGGQGSLGRRAVCADPGDSRWSPCRAPPAFSFLAACAIIPVRRSCTIDERGKAPW